MKKFIIAIFAIQCFVCNVNAQNIFQRFGNWVLEIGQPVHGEFKVGGKSNTKTPLLYLERNLSVLLEIENLRIKISANENKFGEFYESQVFNNSIFPASNDCDKDEVCKNAEIAKCAAFVYLLNLDDAGNPLPATGDFTRENSEKRLLKF